MHTQADIHPQFVEVLQGLVLAFDALAEHAQRRASILARQVTAHEEMNHILQRRLQASQRAVEIALMPRVPSYDANGRITDMNIKRSDMHA